MLDLSANSDFKNIDTYNIVNPFYDINGDLLSNKVEIYGTEALDQYIENVLCTEPGERIFNMNFSSPIYSILFENDSNIDGIINTIFDKIELYVPITIDRNNADIGFDSEEHTLHFKIPYISNDGRFVNVFNRLIKK